MMPHITVLEKEARRVACLRGHYNLTTFVVVNNPRRRRKVQVAQCKRCDMTVIIDTGPCAGCEESDCNPVSTLGHFTFVGKGWRESEPHPCGPIAQCE
jgi:hypothetical protein